jgi:hypothetical protein
MIIYTDEKLKCVEMIYEKGEYEKFGKNKKILLSVRIGGREFKKVEEANKVYIDLFVYKCVSHVAQIKYIESKIRVI